MRRMCLGLVVATFASLVGIAALELDIDDTAIDEAIRLGRRASNAEKTRFHRSYVFPVGAAPIGSVSLVTEFRRVVLAAEDRLRFGDHLWGVREARELLRPARSKLEVIADVNFHPQNAYATVPEYGIRIVPKEGPEVEPLESKTTAKFGLPSVPSPSDPPYYPFPPPSLPSGPGADPLMGAWVAATFDATGLDPRAFVLIAVREGSKDLATVSVDLSRVR